MTVYILITFLLNQVLILYGEIGFWSFTQKIKEKILPGLQSHGSSANQHSSEAVALQGRISSRWTISPKNNREICHTSFVVNKLWRKTFWTTQITERGDTVASWLAHSSLDRAVLVLVLARDDVLCSWARHSASLHKVDKCVLANLMLG